MCLTYFSIVDYFYIPYNGTVWYISEEIFYFVSFFMQTASIWNKLFPFRSIKQ